MQTITLPHIQVENSILVSLKTTGEQLALDMRMFAAITLYQKRRLSLGKAAQLAGMDRLRFIERLEDEQIPIFDYTDREMDEVYRDSYSLSGMLK